MPNAGNFNPEWGYLAPRPGFLRTARVVLLAGIIGTVGGMAVAFALIEHPTEDLPASVAARTMAQSATPDILPKSMAPTAVAEVETKAAHVTASPSSPQPSGEPRDLKDFVAAESHSIATVQSPTGLAALAEAPAMHDAADTPSAVTPVRSAKRPNKVEQPASVAGSPETSDLGHGTADAAKSATPNLSSKQTGKIQASSNVLALAETPTLRDDASDMPSDAAANASPKKPNKKVQVVHARVASNEPNYRSRDSGPFDLLRTLFGGKPLFSNQVR
jgi:hypothetical protein